MLEVPLPYHKLYTTKKPIILITGGRGSGKSFQSTLFEKRLSYEAGHTILHARYTMKNAETSIIPEFQDKIDREEDNKYFDIKRTQILNKFSGSKILFSGIKVTSGNQTANLKGIQGLTTFIVDEAEEWTSDEEFLKLRGSIRTKGVQNRIIIVMNPTDIEHWVYKMFIEKTHEIKTIEDEFGSYEVEISTHPEVEHIHTTYLDNLEHLNESFYKFRKNLFEYKEDDYGNIIMGEWARQQEGVLFPKKELRYFNPNEKHEFETSIAYADIADEGTDSTSIPIGRNKDNSKDIYITDVVFSKLTSEHTIPMFLSKSKEQDVKYIRVESNSMGAMYSRNLRDKVENDMQVLTARSTTNKHTRILMDKGFILKHCVFIAEEFQSEEYKAFMKELCIYNQDPELNKGKHDDAPDSLQGLVNFIRGVLPHVYLESL